jgi:hypothetical protein
MTAPGATRPPLVTTATVGSGPGRWLLSANPGRRFDEQMQHWFADDANKSRCGLLMLAAADTQNEPLSTHARCSKCVHNLEYDAARKPTATPAIEAPPAAAAVRRDRGPAALLAVALELPFADWPRHPSFTWVEFQSAGHGVPPKAHGRPLDPSLPAICGRVPGEALVNSQASTGEARPCSMCINAANKIIRLDSQGRMASSDASD